MRISRGVWVRITAIAAVGLLVLVMRFAWQPHGRGMSHPSIQDRSITSPLNQPGGGAAPDEAYAIYSALYEAPAGEPLAFAENSVTDIPQVDGSCLKPSAPEEREMTAAFEVANRQSHRWEPRFTIPAGYRLLSRNEAAEEQTCLDNHTPQPADCEKYREIRHVRFLGVPGTNQSHTRALVSVVRMCGSYCGSGGIFEVEKTAGTWRRADTTDFTRNCSWMY
jgi:hypothetical protein